MTRRPDSASRAASVPPPAPEPTTRNSQSGGGDVAYPFALALRLAAHNFFIRRLIAFRLAADILLRLRPPGVAAAGPRFRFLPDAGRVPRVPNASDEIAFLKPDSCSRSFCSSRRNRPTITLKSAMRRLRFVAIQSFRMMMSQRDPR